MSWIKNTICALTLGALSLSGCESHKRHRDYCKQRLEYATNVAEEYNLTGLKQFLATKTVGPYSSYCGLDAYYHASEMDTKIKETLRDHCMDLYDQARKQVTKPLEILSFSQLDLCRPSDNYSKHARDIDNLTVFIKATKHPEQLEKEESK